MMRALALLTVLLAGCAGTQPVDFKVVKAKDSCLVNAVGFRDAYEAQQTLARSRWSKVLIIAWSEGGAHAVCVFELHGRLFVFDNNSIRSGSRPITSRLGLKNNPRALAALARPLDSIEVAYFEEGTH